MSGETKEQTSGEAAEAAVSSERLGARVKELRRGSGLTLAGLAEKAGVSRAMLSKVERGEKNPTLVVAARVAGGLGITLARLIDVEEGEAVTVVRREERRVARDPETGFERQEISSDPEGRGVGLAYNVVPEGSTSGELQPRQRDVEEHLIVERGRLRAVVGVEEHLLEAGDAIHFEADTPRRFDNAGEGECGYYLVTHMTHSGPPGR